ncbi:piggyBac transposable element-derived protein 4-like [Photinus pyralis]|nr:piggyBac transposable element-derived protein 4-like [Photinus pyralis]
MSRFRVDGISYNLRDMTLDELYQEIECIEESIPSDSESEVAVSDAEELVDNIEGGEVEEIVLSGSEDSESDLPLATVRDLIINNVTPITTPIITQVYSPPTWSNDYKPTAPPIFTHPSGVPAFIKNIDKPTPYTLFQQLVPEGFIENLVFQTNLYAEQVKQSSGKNYVPTNTTEINTFLGINMLMGIKKSPSYKDYWSTAPDLNDAFICSLMNLKRFSWLLSHLHINDNSLMPPRASLNFDKLFKIRPMIDALSATFENCLLPNQQIAVDESMIKFKGRNSLKQYMPKKPIKRGYKVWILADKSGYCLKFDLYTGKTNSQENCLGSRVIHQLTSHLRRKNHMLYFDNFFNNVPLMEDLKRHDIHAVGTVNMARRYLPTFKPDRTMNRGEFQ